ncbi:HPP family protein [Mucilaginibacter robiniae]|uniref:HPP family protein n=1 Tax=Mucilaginibacter robiniae TaxID=2728022 RepID=A0A7L5DVA8_9SPHI|nr:HPP family protein [Mucilaginibacter robiniae]QJD95030.1 HPP family protein [Mucilaginibacter robiniae]
MRNRYNLKTEVSLALLPTLTMAGVLFLLEAYSKQHLLFASLASSAFLIYIDPQHPTNSIYTLVMAQVSAALIGAGVLKLVGPGYTSAILAMVLAIVFMVLVGVMHPPAVSTALTFAFSTGKTLPLFMIALGLLVILVVLQKVSVWLINRNVPANPISKL